MSEAVSGDAPRKSLAGLLNEVEGGRSLDWFIREFRSLCTKHGWPWLADVSANEFRRRARVLYTTTTRSRYARVRRAQLAAGGFAFLVFSSDPQCGPEHAALDGIALPAEHPFWRLYQPPLRWNCGCALSGARSTTGITRLGGNPNKPLPEWWEQIAANTGAPPVTHPRWSHGREPSLLELLGLIVSGAIGTDQP